MARNVRRNLAEEVERQSGFMSILSWIFNWQVPKVSHPRPMDVAMNNYATYSRTQKRRRLKQPLHRHRFSQPKWSRRKRKHRGEQRKIQHRSSPYQFEEPLKYYDASQVYYYPSHNWSSHDLFRAMRRVFCVKKYWEKNDFLWEEQPPYNKYLAAICMILILLQLLSCGISSADF